MQWRVAVASLLLVVGAVMLREELLVTPEGTVWAVDNSSPSGESIFRR